MAKKVRRVRRQGPRKLPVESQNLAAMPDEEELNAPQDKSMTAEEQELGASRGRGKTSQEEELSAPQGRKLTAQEEDLGAEYAYVMKDLRRVFLLAGLLFVLLIALNLLLG